MKQTFFAHFCAGEKAEEFLPVIDRLRVAGIGAILDYAAESDVPQNKPAQSFSQAKEDLERQQAEMRRQQEEAEQRTRAENGDIIHRQFSPKQEFKDRRMGVVSARTYFYEGEEECDNHMKLFEASIKDSAHRDKGFVAIKVTALGKPELLMRISEIILEIRRLFKKFENGRKEPNPYLDRKISHEDFLYTLQSLDNDLSAEETTALFHKMNISKTGFIDFVDWIESLTPNDETMQPFFSSAYKKGLLPSLNEEECHRMEAMVERLERLAEVAAQNEVRLLVDAEHTYFQPAIDHMVVNMQRRYNKEKPIVFNTYQCYLNDCFGRVAIDLERAKRRDFKFAAKLVRGAYMIQERARALKYNYADPIQPNYEATNQNYHRVMDLILANHERADLMIATHNEKSILHAIQKMREYNIPTDGGVYFGQLLGMCDHVSFTLGRHGYAVYKYVPYGPVKEVMPYLIRRAEENSDILGGVQKERRMLWEELKRRKFVFSA
ncbi:Proline dehydrogenase [Balamuthia mandrillaris]